MKVSRDSWGAGLRPGVAAPRRPDGRPGAARAQAALPPRGELKVPAVTPDSREVRSGLPLPGPFIRRASRRSSCALRVRLLARDLDRDGDRRDAPRPRPSRGASRSTTRTSQPQPTPFDRQAAVCARLALLRPSLRGTRPQPTRALYLLSARRRASPSTRVRRSRATACGAPPSGASRRCAGVGGAAGPHFTGAPRRRAATAVHARPHTRWRATTAPPSGDPRVSQRRPPRLRIGLAHPLRPPSPPASISTASCSWAAASVGARGRTRTMPATA